MNLKTLLHQLWYDEIGVILSAEAALLGTVAVLGTTVGLSALSRSVNDELTELASAFRSLDQSYHYEGQYRCGAWTAGSSYQQRPVGESLEELCTFVEELEEHQHHSEHRRHHEEADDDEDDRDERTRNRRESDENDEDRSEGRRESDDDDDDRPRGRQTDDDDDDEDRPRDRDRDDDELSLEFDAADSEFSEPIRIRPAAAE